MNWILNQDLQVCTLFQRVVFVRSGLNEDATIKYAMEELKLEKQVKHTTNTIKL